MSLYNLKTDGDQWRITKFTNDLDVEASYLVSQDECECPARRRPTCRHRQMLPRMLAEGIANTDKFYDFDTGDVLVPIEQVDFDKLSEPRSGLPTNPDEPHPSIGKIERRI